MARATEGSPTASSLGLPLQLRAGLEALSGLDLSEVRVHRNSPQPLQLNAMAYAQGHDIHLSPGQEHHLPHEAWHVVQQATGRVRATGQVQGWALNDEPLLEREADVMGARALQAGAVQLKSTSTTLIARPASPIVQARAVLVLPNTPGLIVPGYGGGVIQAAGKKNRGGRLVTGLVTALQTGEADRAALYLGGWIADVVDYYAKGNLYDTIQLVYAVIGGHGGGTLARLEEAVRFVQHHPEILSYAVQVAPIITTYFGVPPWAVQILLSRGAAADSLGAYLTSLVVPEWLAPYVPVRHLGRSLLDRGLALTHGLASYIPGGAQLVSGISRFFHGYSLNTGTKAKAPALVAPGQALNPLYQLLADIMPMERLHIVPAKDGGKLNQDNAVYGSAAANSMMIPNERQHVKALAIQSPTGMAEAITMGAWCRLRGVRPREGEIEHYAASHGFA